MYIVTYEYNNLEYWEEREVKFMSIVATLQAIKYKLENPNLYRKISVNHISE